MVVNLLVSRYKIVGRNEVANPIHVFGNPNTKAYQAAQFLAMIAPLLALGPEADTGIAADTSTAARGQAITRPASEAGLTSFERGAAKVPEDSGPGIANKKGVGIRWTDPTNQGNGVRIDQGIPDSPWPSQQVDHVVVRSGGRILGPDGKPIVGSLQDNPQAHIPLFDWLNWTSWNTP